MEIVIDQLCDINTAENTWRGTHGLTVLRQQPAGHSLRQASLLTSPGPVEHIIPAKNPTNSYTSSDILTALHCSTLHASIA